MSGGRGPRVLYVIVCAAGPASGVGELIGAAMGEGWEVCVLATPAAVAFLDVAAVETQTGWPVFSEYRRPGEAKRQPPADAVVVAPATYNTINKWAAGIVDNYALGSFAEATGLGLPVVVLASVGEALAGNRVFRRSLDTLREAGVQVQVQIRCGSEEEARSSRGRWPSKPCGSETQRGPLTEARGPHHAEAEGFEPSMGLKAQTALAVRRHRPD